MVDESQRSDDIDDKLLDQIENQSLKIEVDKTSKLREELRHLI